MSIGRKENKINHKKIVNLDSIFHNKPNIEVKFVKDQISQFHNLILKDYMENN